MKIIVNVISESYRGLEEPSRDIEFPLGNYISEMEWEHLSEQEKFDKLDEYLTDYMPFEAFEINSYHHN